MNILVTGATGYLGVPVVEELVGRGHRVTAHVHRRVPGHFVPTVSYVRGEQTEGQLPAGVDAVIHLACPNMADCELDPARLLKEHVARTMALARACAHAAPLFIYVSSCSVFGAAAGVVDEDTPPHPLTPYAQLKVAAETALLAEGLPFPLMVVRLATLYGLGTSVRSNLLLNRLVHEACQQRSVTIQGPRLWRPFLHVRDAAELLADLLLDPRPARSAILCAGSSQQTCKLESVATLLKQELPGVQVRLGPAGQDRRSYRPSFARLNKHLPFNPRRTLTDGIRELRVWSEALVRAER